MNHRQQEVRVRTRDRRGMTLMEVMIVIALIVLLMGVLSFGVLQMFEQGRQSAAELQINKINQQVTMYTVRHKGPPTSIEDLYKRQEVPVDPWGSPYVLRSGGGRDGKDYDILSYGQDMTEGGGDDIRLSELL
jgi:general secretion pathway protein G